MYQIHAQNGNAFYGESAGENNTGVNNTFVGAFSGQFNTEGKENTFLGSSSGNKNTTGNMNVFSGFRSGRNNTTGYRNTFLGAFSGLNNSTGGANTFLGTSSGIYNTEGFNNTFLGNQAGAYNNNGHYNTFVGSNAGKNNTTGSDNVFFGGLSGYANTTGKENTFLGAGAGYLNATGNFNIFLGRYAGRSNTTGKGNIYLGYQAGRNNNGSGNVFIGRDSGVNFTQANNTLVIQDKEVNRTPLLYGDFVTGDVAIGNTSTSGYKLYVNGDAFATGLWVSNVTAVLNVAKSKSQPIENALEKINTINSTVNTTTTKTADKKSITKTQYAVNATDMQKVFPNLVKQQEGSTAINYQGLIPVLMEAIKEMKEQHNATIQELKEEIAALKNSESNQGSQSGSTFTASGFKLAQNIPNPFEASTIISYSIPEGYQNGASIQIFDGNGLLIRSFTNLQSGDGAVQINNLLLPAGIYHYSLIVNSKVMASKKMVIKK